MKRLNRDIFIERSNQIHNGKFNYELVEYKNTRTPVKIICPKCGVFEQLPWTHMKGIGCAKCNIQTRDTFISKAIKKHNNRYSYDDVKFIDNNTKVSIICVKHGIFEQTPASHLSGSGCMKCFRENKLHNTEKFIKKSIHKHGNLYNYELVNYINNRESVSIICKKHGIFNQKANHHLLGCGCPACNISKGELEIKKFLITNDIGYISQKTFDDCYDKALLRFDFYLPELNMCIEYNGLQHYEVVEYFGGIDNFYERQKRDMIKEKYCLDKGIKLLIIKYNDDISNVMTNILERKIKC